jgi:hypothetical protein
MRQRRRTNSEVRLDRLQDDGTGEDEQRGILELFHRDGEVEPDVDAALERDPDE